MKRPVTVAVVSAVLVGIGLGFLIATASAGDVFDATTRGYAGKPAG